MSFPSSVWTQLLEFRREPERVKDLIARRYRGPVYEFIVRQGVRDEDAEDLAQEVFLRICRDSFLERVDPAKGKFRALLLAVTRHVIASFRRHALAAARDRRREVALDDMDFPREVEPDAEFDRLWVKNLVRQAMEDLKDDPAMPALQLQLEGRSYQEIAARLGRAESDVTNHLHRAKKRLRARLEGLIRDYAGAGELEAEIATLLAHL